MKRGRVVRMSEYRSGFLARGERKAGSNGPKPLPDANHLWELLDRNISIDVWKKGT